MDDTVTFPLLGGITCTEEVLSLGPPTINSTFIFRFLGKMVVR